MAIRSTITGFNYGYCRAKHTKNALHLDSTSNQGTETATNCVRYIYICFSVSFHWASLSDECKMWPCEFICLSTFSHTVFGLWSWFSLASQLWFVRFFTASFLLMTYTENFVFVLPNEWDLGKKRRTKKECFNKLQKKGRWINAARTVMQTTFDGIQSRSWINQSDGWQKRLDEVFDIAFSQFVRMLMRYNIFKNRWNAWHSCLK